MSPVIGLEVHVQLRTERKLFCGCRTRFGAVPNTQVCESCYGLPGALPVLNPEAVELAVRTALGLGFQVRELSRFERKHYFYPDLPRGYQITQHHEPLATGGILGLAGGEDVKSGERRVRLRRLHLEEDTARSLHEAVPGATALDFNRAGVPLVEIVTEPELTSPAETRALLVALRRLLEFLEVSDCNMEEGSLRVDANVSLRKNGSVGERTEVKNLNSFANVERALAFEIDRQSRRLARGEPIRRQTRLWDADAGVTRPLRGKEESADYRYLPEADLLPLGVDPEAIQRIRLSLPELPGPRAARMRQNHAIGGEQAGVLCSSRALADRFEDLVSRGVTPGLAASWLLGEEMARSRPSGSGEPPVEPVRLAELLIMLDEGEITRAQARAVAGEMEATPRSARAIAADRGLAEVRDPEVVLRWAREVIEANTQEVERYRAGDHRLMNFFIGRAMSISEGAASPAAIAASLRKLLER